MTKLFDDLMVIDRDDHDSYNLAVGEPYFLRDALHDVISAVDAEYDLCYPKLYGEEQLLAEIRKYHHWDGPVVVGNGARQVMTAVAYALKDSFPWDTQGTLYTKAPFWPGYRAIAQTLNMKLEGRITDGNFSGEKFFDKLDRPVIVINTSPNNPDGATDFTECDIWDAAYAHPVYGFGGFDVHRAVPPTWHHAAAYSASKLLGVSGLRVGWALVKHEAVAKKAAMYIEQTTSGVCTLAQIHVANILRFTRKEVARTQACYQNAYDVLRHNNITFDSTIRTYIDTRAANGLGMFQWFLPKSPEGFAAALKLAKVKLVEGAACGSGYKDWYRMSMGHRTLYTEQALERLSALLKVHHESTP